MTTDKQKIKYLKKQIELLEKIIELQKLGTSAPQIIYIKRPDWNIPPPWTDDPAITYVTGANGELNG